MLSQELLKELFTYHPETGHFTRNVTRGGQLAGSVAGSIDTCGYRQMRFCGRKRSCHRLAWLYTHGVWPEFEIDHINGDKLDNRILNLRPATRSGNMTNIGARRSSKTGVKGVDWDKQHLRYRAQIMVDGRKKNLGRFDTIEEAAKAYADAAARLHGEFARIA